MIDAETRDLRQFLRNDSECYQDAPAIEYRASYVVKGVYSYDMEHGFPLLDGNAVHVDPFRPLFLYLSQMEQDVRAQDARKRNCISEPNLVKCVGREDNHQDVEQDQAQ